MRRKISPELLEEIRRNYLVLFDKRPSDASAYLRQTAKQLDINLQTLHRHLKLRVRNPRTPDPSLAEKYAEHDAYGRLVWQFINENTFDDVQPSITMAYRVLRNQDRIPKEITRGQIYASIQRQHLKAQSEVPFRRFERRSPMDLWQVDFSKSRFFKYTGEDEIQVCPPHFTKRQSDGNSLWFGVAIDDASRVAYLEYFIAKGEDSLTVQSFLLNSFKIKNGRKLLQGMPKAIYVDRGSAWLTKSMETGLAKLGIDQVVGANEKTAEGRTIGRSNKKARGKVERFIRDVKDNMEQELFLTCGAGRRLSLAEFGFAVEAWMEERNCSRHPTRSGETKWGVYSSCLTDLKSAPDEALAYFTHTIVKKVSRRMINVGKGVYCIAPMFMENGDTAEVIQDNAGHYVFHKGNRYKLEYQEGTTPEQLEKLKVRHSVLQEKGKRSELEVDSLTDYPLRMRFMDELGIPLNALPDEIWQDLSPFFQEPKTIAEIKHAVDWVRERMQPRLPKNVIQVPLERYG